MPFKMNLPYLLFFLPDDTNINTANITTIKIIAKLIFKFSLFEFSLQA